MVKKIPKIKQIIWVSPGVFSSLADLSEASGKPINVIISEILEKWHSGEMGETKVVERKIKIDVPIYECPFCYERFSDAKAFRKHLKEKWRDHFEEIHDEEDIGVR